MATRGLSIVNPDYPALTRQTQPVPAYRWPRPDGYHELQTLFQFLDYGDELTFTLTPEQPGIRLAEPVPGVPDSDNLVIRAAKALAATTENTLPPGVTIHIHKHLPMGGGLGGGSSNAATTLLAMNRLWGGLNLGEDQLAEIGLRLGADVPVFVRGHAAFGEGVGEKLTPPTNPPEDWFVVLKPECNISTGKIFFQPKG